MNATQILGVEEAVRLVCRELAVFAAPGKLPRRDGGTPNVRRMGDIEVWFSPTHTGVARFHLVTWDNVEADIEIDFGGLTSEYLQNIAVDVRQAIDGQRARRQSDTLH